MLNSCWQRLGRSLGPFFPPFTPPGGPDIGLLAGESQDRAHTGTLLGPVACLWHHAWEEKVAAWMGSLKAGGERQVENRKEVEA